MNRRRARLAAGAFVGVALALGAARVVRGGGRGTPSDVPTFKLAKAPFSRRITAEGNLKAVQSTPVSAPQTRMPMTIAWLAADGVRVSKDEPVVRFDPTQMEKSLADATADRATADLKIDKERIQSATKQSDRERTAGLTQAELEKARAFPAQDPRFFSKMDIADAEIDDALYEARLRHASETRGTEQKLTRSKLDLLAIDRRKADVLVKQAQDALKDLEARAPHEGILVMRRDWRGQLPRVGDTIWPGNELAEIAAPAEMQAVVYVLEADAGGLAVGKAASVVIDASPDVAYAGKIKLVDALAQPRVSEVPVNYFGATIALDKSDPAIMKPGQRVTATLVLEDLPEALVAPRQAVFDRDGHPIVYRLAADRKRFEPIDVKLGATSAGRVVIDKGVQAGDVLALRDPTRSLDDALRAPGDESSGAAPAPGAAVTR